MVLLNSATPNPESVQFAQDGSRDLTLAGYGASAPFQDFIWQYASIGDSLPPWWSRARDAYLRGLMRGDSLFSGIIYQETARVKNTNWQLATDTPDLDLQPYRDILNGANFGKGFRDFLHKVALDLLTQDNGAFIELQGKTYGEDMYIDAGDYAYIQTKPLVGMPTGIASMDAGQCYRTLDPEYPVIYENPYPQKGKPTMVLMHWTRVHAMSQFTQNYELGRGLGLCALSRMFLTLRYIADMNTYKHEKISFGGEGMVFVGGVSKSVLERAQVAQESLTDARGLTRYKGKLVIPVASDTPVTISEIEAKKTPDNFNYTQDLEDSVKQAAIAAGLDLRDIGWPGVGAGQTRADAEIADLKAANKGRADVLRDIQEFIDTRVMPKDITFEFNVDNILSEQRKAEISQIRAVTRAQQIMSGEITSQEARAIAVEFGDIPPAFALEGTQVANSTDEEVAEGEDLNLEEAVPEVTKGMRETQRDFKGNFASAIRSLSEGEVSPFSVKVALTLALNNGLEEAYVTGVRAGGQRTDLSREQRNELISFRQSQTPYIQNILDFAATQPDSAMINNRIDLWQTKALQQARNAGYASAMKEKPVRWVLGRTKEHCPTCETANGKIAPASAWMKEGIMPQSDILDCRGFHCDCRLEAVKEKVGAYDDLSSIPTSRTKQMSIEAAFTHTHAKAGKYDHISFKPPEGVRKAAARGLALRDEFNRGGTAVGIARARDLKNGATISPDTAKRMHSFFSRHSAYEKNHETNPPSNSYISWLLWGGDAGRSWAAKLVRQMEAADDSND